MQQNIDMGYKNRFIVFLLFSSIVLTAQTGIGTTTPVNKLQVETTLADPASSGALANGNLRLSASSGSHVLDFGLSSSSTYSWLQSRSRSNYTTNFNLILNPNGGNVGIGTTSPGDPLVVGSFAIHDGGNKVIGFGYSPGVGKNLLTGFPAEIRLDPANGSLSLGTSATSFTSGTTPTLTARMVITSQGNVGIGTASPTATLEVNGTTKLGGTTTIAGAATFTSTVAITTGAGAGKVLTSDANGVASWTTLAGGVTTMAAIGSVPNANGASISGTTLTLQPADATNGGVVNTTNQTFAGSKTFSSDISVIQ